MKKKHVLRKAAALLLAGAMLTGTASAERESTELAESPNDKAIQNVLKELLQEEIFHKLYQNGYRDEVERLAMDTYLNEKNKSVYKPKIADGSIAYHTAPIIKQETDYYCGFASMQQILASLSLNDNIPGSTNREKQDSLKNYQNSIITSQGGIMQQTAVVSYIPLVLNHYLNYGLYNWYGVDNNEVSASRNVYDMTDFAMLTYNSLAVDRPIIMYTNTEKLSYYKGTRYTHYIVVDYIDRSRLQVETADCCWTEAYRGHFMVSMDEAYNAVKGNYMICLSQQIS